MCEANAYLLKEGKEELILEAVDIVEPHEEGKIRLANIFGEQKQSAWRQAPSIKE
jgi:predicted RNA-binding protein